MKFEPETVEVLSGGATESSVRYVPLAKVTELMLQEEDFATEWQGASDEEKREWLREVLADADVCYNANMMSDYDYTYKELEDKESEDGFIVLHDDIATWRDTYVDGHDEFVFYYEAYAYCCTLSVPTDEEGDIVAKDIDIRDLGDGTIEDSGWFISDAILSHLNSIA